MKIGGKPASGVAPSHQRRPDRGDAWGGIRPERCGVWLPNIVATTWAGEPEEVDGPVPDSEPAGPPISAVALLAWHAATHVRCDEEAMGYGRGMIWARWRSDVEGAQGGNRIDGRLDPAGLGG